MKALLKLSNWIFVISASMVIFAGITYKNENFYPNSKMDISYLKSLNYPGSEIVIEKVLPVGSNYKRYIVSFKSEGLKEYAYLTIPDTEIPTGGFPVIVFVHGFQIPELYTPDGNYIPHMDSLAKQGYIIFKPDLRGHGKSDGAPGSAYYMPGYTIDVLNAVASVAQFKFANPEKIGLWGHSMGGNLVLKAAEIYPNIKACVIWGGVVGSFNDLIFDWQEKVTYKPTGEDLYLRNLGLQELIAYNGNPNKNTDFWYKIDPTYNLRFIHSPIQINVGLSDNQVPPEFSKKLYEKLQSSGKTVEYFEYPDANHDIDKGFSEAIRRSVDFFNKYLK